ncbi:helix-turn-helix transcriptional regulator [Solibacillus sp. FSL H8-0538]|uniref:helix-turn-helix transcriptional regulator n=1 Tax=Solibacillus sp. FSL H8-0538 TaxID=2921400 RepID=UPI0030F958F3
MDRDFAIDIVSEKLKLIRTENDYTQDKMAEVIGISKKTLVQIEKGRISAGWTTSVAVCALFRESSILQNAFGGDPLEVIELTAHDVISRPKEKTLGGYIWWRDVKIGNGYRLQQNILSQHFRILDEDNYRLYSSFEEQIILKKWQTIVN